jgi:hypothetical protein
MGAGQLLLTLLDKYGFLLCDTQRNYWKSAKIDPIAWRFGHEGFVKTKIV